MDTKAVVRGLFIVFLLAGLVGIAIAPSINSVNAAPVQRGPVQLIPACGLTMAQWTFDPTPSSATAPAPSTANVTALSSTGANLQGLSFTTTGAVSGNAWTADHWSTATSIDSTKYFEFDVSTLGYASIVMTFAVSRSGTGPTTISVQYSTDGTSYTELQTNPVSATPTLTTITADFSSITSLGSNSNAKFRIYGYNASGLTGSMHVDDVTFTGCSIVTIDSIAPNPTNSGTTVTWHALENGTYDVRVGGTNCTTGTSIFTVPLPSYTTSPATVNTPISASALVSGSNTIIVCVTNSVSGVTDFAIGSVTEDTTPPSILINLASGQATSTSTLPINFSVVFSEPIDASTFTKTDITQSGTATGITWSIIDSGDHTNFTLRATAITSGGTLIPSIAAGKVTDLAGNGNLASTTSTGNTVTYIPIVPTPCPISYHSLLINEVGWMGTKHSSSDEWIELYNPSACTIDLNNWTLGGANNYYTTGNFTIPLANTPNSLTIAPDHYLVITSNSNVFQSTSITFTPLVASNLNLANYYQSLKLVSPSNTLVDTANYAGSTYWPAGSASPNYASMERNGHLDDGPAAWVTYAGPTGPTSTNVKDYNGNYIRGTPGGPNWSATVTVTPSPAPTPTKRYYTPTSPPPTPAPKLAINEFLPRAGYDWNNDGKIDVYDEFIEIENVGVINVNMSGWRLTDDPNSGSSPFSLPSQIIKPGQRMVFYGSKTHILLIDSGDSVRLINSRGVIVDARTYGPVTAPDQSWCRIPDGIGYWTHPCFPTPGNENALTGSAPVQPTSIAIEPTPCLLADTVSIPFVDAICNAFGADIWNNNYWNALAGQKDFPVPDDYSKWQTTVQ